MPKYNYLEVSPPAIISDRVITLYIDINQYPIDKLALHGKMLEYAASGQSLNWECVENDKWAAAEPPQSEYERDGLTTRLHEEAAREWCELLNFVLHATGVEISDQSYVELVEDLPVPIDDIPIE